MKDTLKSAAVKAVKRVSKWALPEMAVIYIFSHLLGACLKLISTWVLGNQRHLTKSWWWVGGKDCLGHNWNPPEYFAVQPQKQFYDCAAQIVSAKSLASDICTPMDWPSSMPVCDLQFKFTVNEFVWQKTSKLGLLFAAGVVAGTSFRPRTWFAITMLDVKLRRKVFDLVFVLPFSEKQYGPFTSTYRK